MGQALVSLATNLNERMDNMIGELENRINERVEREVKGLESRLSETMDRIAEALEGMSERLGRLERGFGVVMPVGYGRMVMKGGGQVVGEADGRGKYGHEDHEEYQEQESNKSPPASLPTAHHHSTGGRHPDITIPSDNGG